MQLMHIALLKRGVCGTITRIPYLGYVGWYDEKTVPAGIDTIANCGLLPFGSRKCGYRAFTLLR